MSRFIDPYVAQAAVANPATSAADLAEIAQTQPALRAAVAQHPAAYPGLLDWLVQFGDPAVSAAVAQRRARDAAYGPSGQPGRQPGARKGRAKPILAAGVGVVVLALVAVGVLTRGFGLFPAGGADSPQAEALGVADKAVSAINSFSAGNVLNNPLSALGALSDEIAPSEKRTPNLVRGQAAPNLTDLLGINSDSVNLLTQFAGSFKVEARDLQTAVTPFGEEVAVVWFTGGSLTTSIDVDKLAAALASLPDVAKRQAQETLAKYGIDSRLDEFFADQFRPGWQDYLLESARSNPTNQVDLSQLWGELQSACGGNRSEDEYDYFYPCVALQSSVPHVVVVKEGGRWYLSTLLTTGLMGRDLLDVEETGRIVSALNVTPMQNRSAVDAAGALVSALQSGDDRAVLRQLPLPERRMVAFNPSLLNNLRYVEGGQFTEVANSGGFAKLRIDSLQVNGYSIYDGSCVASDYDRYNGACLKDSLRNSVQLPSGQYRVDPYTGIDMGLVMDKIQAAVNATANAINPDDVGIVAVQENGGWYVSFLATAADLQQQLSAAITVGLKSVAVR